ncbi:MAG TPA: rhodanese-like domain-containing protein [Smithella sp.]|jgi:thiosulfate/3-mercaptopyruvate sulfurtransferase|nr:sulfurtransferase [Smithella sp.]OQC54334.1 MAG: Thiosulfate sulfurtransferase [Deltaproteobacteria bacterium ADurb.Bin022]HOQ41574.1 rhodanese-like domain-containing protein [Smithellaceae bacterium]HNQ65926.1 rhodanese-like domain-containing protein [Smithella sp.]HOE32469.1 rhodanese-like domain-containing protein [Smithella sp.]
MKRMRFLKVLLVSLLILLPAAVLAQGLSPIVSTDDLAKIVKDPNVIVIDIRKVEDYKAGHIPGAIGVFYNNWAPGMGGLKNEMPADDDLMDLLTDNGIQPDSTVVVYGTTGTPPDRVDVTRVAWALKYAGVQKVSVLSGGFEKWAVREKKEVSTEITKPKTKDYKGKINKAILVNKDYVKNHVGKAMIVDAREPAFFKGEQKLPFVAKAGRVKNSVNLPTIQVFDKYPPGEHMEPCCWTYKDVATLKNIASGVVGSDIDKEIIVYCDTGKVASAWWFILSDVMGFKNVKIYDGSMEEWMNDASAPTEP